MSLSIIRSRESAITADEFKAAFRNHPGGVAVITADAGNGPVLSDVPRATIARRMRSAGPSVAANRFSHSASEPGV